MVYLLSKLEVWNQFCWLQLLCCMSCLQNSSTIDQNLPVTPTSRLWKPWLWKFYSDGCEFFQYQSPWVWLIAYSTMCSEFAYFTISFCFMANEYYVILWLIYIYIYIQYHNIPYVYECTYMYNYIILSTYLFTNFPPKIMEGNKIIEEMAHWV